MSVQLTAEIAKALGVPERTRKAVLTLEAGKPPLLDIEVFVRDGAQYAFDPVDPNKLRTMRFMLRLEPFPE